MKCVIVVATTGLVALLAASTGLAAEGWGTVKGQVVWGPAALPEKVKANVDKDQAHCLSKGEIFIDAYVVNPKNKGVRWVLVWLVDPDLATKPLPINPQAKETVLKHKAVIDQPCCKFEPRVMGIMEGQKVVAKNSAPIPHNIFWQGGVLGPNSNDLLPANGEKEYDGMKSRLLPVPYTCSIHGWMKGYVGVFKHPYFAVTDEDGNFTIPKAPAGKYRLILWQETRGFVIQDPKNPKDRGIVIDIKADGTTDLGQVKLEPRKE